VAQIPAENKRRGWGRQTWRNFATGMAFISLWIIGFLAFNLYPMIASLYYSFTEYHIKNPPLWIGLQNYTDMLADQRFYKGLVNTGYMVVIGVSLGLVLSFMCAVLLNLKVRGQSIYRVMYYLPSIVPTVAGSLLFMWILNPSSGMINRVLGYVGLPGPDWLHDPLWAKPALIMLGLWGIGGTIIIYLSGLQDVPVSLLEAAQLDGASWMQRLRFVTIPMVSPITLYNLITGVIAMFQYFTQAYVFASASSPTGSALGSPLDSTLFYSVYLYHVGFQYLKMGYASAMAWILFIIIMVCTLLLMRISNRWTYYAG